LDSALPFCERYGVQIGIQNHYGNSLPVNEMGLYHLVKDYDPRYVGAIWDPAHNALEGMEPEPALDIVASHLCVVNLKNAYWRRISGPEAETAQWKVYWTSGRQGRASWARVAAKIKQMGYTGPVCFSAEYSDEHNVDRLIVEDLAFARGLFE
jgi:sugar phosphate isomerase/epimerase